MASEIAMEAARKVWVISKHCSQYAWLQDAATIVDVARQSAFDAGLEWAADRGFKVVMALEESENNYSALQKAASVAAAIRSRGQKQDQNLKG